MKRLFEFLNPKIDIRDLDDHAVIGLDLDGTLISGKHHKDIEEWLKHTHARVHIITFRHHINDKLGEYLQGFKAVKEIHTLPRKIPEFSPDYLKWKGKVCKKIDATLLIDDDIAAVEKGCKKYGIQLYDAKHWLKYQKKKK